MNISSKHREIVIHILIWVFWFLVPVLSSLSEIKQRPFSYQVFVPMIFSVILFYSNYLFLIDKLLFKQRFIAFMLINIGIISVIILLSEFINNTFFFNDAVAINRHKPPRHVVISGFVFMYIFIISIGVAIRTTARWLTVDAERRVLENENLRSELNNLKMQLNPHFFFNTLNNIYSLIQVSPDRAMEAVHGLARLMRYHLYETNAEKVPLMGEVDFMKSYVSLMQLRTTKDVKVEQEFSFEHDNDLVAPLLFVPLLENAFKHGVSGDTPSVIRIFLEEREHVLSIQVENSVILEIEKSEGSKGIGLDNLQKRLQLIYPNRHLFKSAKEDDMFKVKMVIQLV